jgi:2-oxoglutarate ferredoxin oxidoreductase subunit delta
MAKVQGYVVVNTQRCKGCNLCVVSCPTDVLELQPREVNDRGYHYVYMKNPGECIGCFNCGTVLPRRMPDRLPETSGPITKCFVS